MDNVFKNQYNPILWLSYIVVVVSSLIACIGECFMYAMVSVAIIGAVLFSRKVIKRSPIELFDILGLVVLLLYTLCVLLIPFFEVLLFLFSCILLISMMVCMVRCKNEDAKAIAILHVIYIFSCNLVMPCIGMSI